MKMVQNDCCGCKDIGLPCRGSECPNRDVEHFYCDICGAEETLYEYEDQQICHDCLMKNFPVVYGSEL